MTQNNTYSFFLFDKEYKIYINSASVTSVEIVGIIQTLDHWESLLLRNDFTVKTCTQSNNNTKRANLLSDRSDCDGASAVGELGSVRDVGGHLQQFFV